MGRRPKNPIAEVTPVTLQGAVPNLRLMSAEEALNWVTLQFLEVDSEGRPVVDAWGELQVHKSFSPFVAQLLSEYVTTTKADIAERLREDDYDSEAEQQRDHDLQTAMLLVERDLRGDDDILTVAELQAMQRDGQKLFQEHAIKVLRAKLASTIETVRAAGIAIPDGFPSPEDVAREVELEVAKDPAAAEQFAALELKFLEEPDGIEVYHRLAAFDAFLTAEENGQTLLHRVVLKLLNTIPAAQ